MKKGFSLVELLISLIIISLITAALAPTLTKKIKHKDVVFSSVQKIKNDCSIFDSTDGVCLLCSEKECSLCSSSINIPDGYFVNPSETCNRQSCTKFDAKCKKCTKEGCQECAIGYRLNSSKKCELATCNKGFYLSGSTCVECAAGTFQASDNSTATSCTACISKTPNCAACGTKDGVCSACQTGYDLNGTTCIALFDTKTFYYTGSVQTWTAPFSGTFKFEVWGAQGGARRASGGYGGYAQGRKALSAGQTLYIYVGGMGGAPTGGWNGGGNGGSDEGGGGGGASDIRIGGTDYANRIIVAGGGGGGGYGLIDRYSTGGTGGGAAGGMGTNSCSHCGTGGQQAQATQSGGAFLGRGSSAGSAWEGGGGGGGYFGGTYGGNYNGGSGGGGGSGFIGGVTSGSMQNGVRTGHGVAIITKI